MALRCLRHTADAAPGCLHDGEEAARVFYEPGRFTRRQAMPVTTVMLLQDFGSVQLLDDKAHRHRKQMFLSFTIDPAQIQRLVEITGREWEAALPDWENAPRVVLHEQSRQVLCRAVCAWAGVPLPESDVERRSREFGAMIDAAATTYSRKPAALARRTRTERWIQDIVVGIRSGRIDVAAGSAAHVIAWHQDVRAGSSAVLPVPRNGGRACARPVRVARSRDGRPPNNWESAFGGPAWTYEAQTAQYHHFSNAQQPDLNWRNPDLPFSPRHRDEVQICHRTRFCRTKRQRHWRSEEGRREKIEAMVNRIADRVDQLAGSRCHGTIQVVESAINDLLATASSGGTAPTVTVLEHNWLVIRYGALHARAQLAAVADSGGSPRVTLSLASVVVAWAVRAAVRQPFVQVQGRRVTVEIAAVPALSPWRDLWPHVKDVEIATAAGMVAIRFHVSIDSGDAHE